MTLVRHIDRPERGMRIAMCPNGYSSRGVEVWTVSSTSETQIFLKREEYGAVKELTVGRNLSGNGWHAVWTHAVPKLESEDLQHVICLLSDSSYSKHAYAFEVGPDSDDGHVLIPVGWQEESRIVLARDHTQRILPKKSIDFLPDAPPIAISEGMRVLMRPRATRDGDAQNIVVTDCEVVDLKMPREELDFLLSRTEGPFSSKVWPVGDGDTFGMEIGQCLARHREDKVIILCVETGTIEKPDDTKVVLHHQGAKLYWTDNLNDDVWNVSVGEGVWIGEDISWHDCGEDGAEWEAGWGKASIEDIVGDISFSEFREYYVDLVEGDLSWGRLRALFANPWDAAYRTEDGGGSTEAAGSVATTWIEKIGSCEYAACKKPEIQSEVLMDGGSVTTLFLNGMVAATATVVRDDANFSVLTRWVDEDLTEALFQKSVKAWIDSDAS